MKEKLELKHINPYADKALKGLFNGVEDIVTGIDYEFGIISSLNTGSVLIRDFKPLLHPLDRLIESGYHFIYDQETDWESILDWVSLDCESRLTCKFSFEFWQLLFDNHFDVFGLIEKGLAEPIKYRP